MTSGSSSNDGAVEQSDVRRREEIAYEAVYRALKARWLTLDWEMSGIHQDLQSSLHISYYEQFRPISTRVDDEFEEVKKRRVRDPAQPCVAPDESDPPGRGRPDLTQRLLFTEHELQCMEKVAYEAVERAFGAQEGGTPSTNRHHLRLLSKLRNLLGISEDLYNEVMKRVDEDEDPSDVEPPLEPDGDN